MFIDGLDELDNQILTLVQENARLTYKEIGERIGVSRVSVKNRLDSLQERGIIQGYHAVVNARRVSEGVHFLMDLEVVPDRYEEIVEMLAKSKQVRQIYSVSGDCRLHVVGYASNNRSMEYFVNQIHRGQRGLRLLSCRTIMSTLMDRDGGVEYERYQGNEHLEGGRPEGTGK